MSRDGVRNSRLAAAWLGLCLLIFAIGFVILTLPVGIAFTDLSRRLAVKR